MCVEGGGSGQVGYLPPGNGLVDSPMNDTATTKDFFLMSNIVWQKVY